ncbi:MAG: prolyl oligopeptidase family serine peptidase [Bacteroidales bacterium]|nr:prolyl oligopeptidase family serine peptidase [Bacteroidales bacterium]
MISTRTLTLSWMVFLTLLVTTAAAQPSRFSREFFTNSKGDTLHYRLLVSDYSIDRRYPLVIFLHGSGERGLDNDAQLKWGVMNFATDEMMKAHPAFVIAPQCPPELDWTNAEWNEKTHSVRLLPNPSKPIELVIALIKEFSKRKDVDSTRIYITGLSMGGFGVFDAIERYPHLFAAAVPVCGGGDTSKAASVAHLPIWIFQGAADGAVAPEHGVDMLKALQKAGGHPGFTLYPEVGHFSWLGAYTDPMLYEWLFRQHK